MLRTVASCVLVAIMATVGIAADRKWQTGTWGEITTTRRVVDFGPGASGFGRPGTTLEMRAMADLRHFVIETDEMHNRGGRYRLGRPPFVRSRHRREGDLRG